MQELTREERDLILNLRALRRGNFPRYSELLKAFNGLICSEVERLSPQMTRKGQIVDFETIKDQSNNQKKQL